MLYQLNYYGSPNLLLLCKAPPHQPWPSSPFFSLGNQNHPCNSSGASTHPLLLNHSFPALKHYGQNATPRDLGSLALGCGPPIRIFFFNLLGGLPSGSAGEEIACDVGDRGSILGGNIPGEGEKATPLQYSGWKVPGLCGQGEQRVRYD